jgi:septum formation topological specificity factor MinE
MEKEREAARIEQEKADEENKKLQAEIAQKAKKEAEAIEAEKQRQELGDIPKFKAMRDELLLVIAKYSFTSEKAKSAQEAMRVSLLPKTK